MTFHYKKHTQKLAQECKVSMPKTNILLHREIFCLFFSACTSLPASPGTGRGCLFPICVALAPLFPRLLLPDVKQVQLGQLPASSGPATPQSRPVPRLPQELRPPEDAHCSASPPRPWPQLAEHTAEHNPQPEELRPLRGPHPLLCGPGVWESLPAPSVPHALCWRSRLLPTSDLAPQRAVSPEVSVSLRKDNTLRFVH